MLRTSLLSLSLLALACGGPSASGPGSPTPAGDEGEGEGPGEGEGEGEGDAAGVAVGFTADGAALDALELVIATRDVSAGPLDVAMTLDNRGDVAFDVLSTPPLLLAGPDAAMFSIPAQLADLHLEPGESAPFVLRYTPTLAGAHEGALLFAWGVKATQRVFLDITAEATGGAPPPTTTPGLAAAIYDGAFDVLPDFDAITPTETVVTSTFDISARAPTSDVGDAFAYRFDGFLEVPADGAWTFTTTSDDGSRVWIDGALVVDNDGLHGPVEVSGEVALSAGPHAIRVGFFENSGGAMLSVEWSGPGRAREPIPADVLSHASTAP